MIAIGIDPGTAITGCGVVKKENNNFICLYYGIIETNKENNASFRLNVIRKKISSIIKEYSPDIVAIEKVYFCKNIKTAISVSEAKGVIMVTAEEAKIPIFEFTPLEMKISITGYGRANKKQVQEMIKLSLNLQELPRPDDAADALGIAMSGIIRYEGIKNNIYENNN